MVKDNNVNTLMMRRAIEITPAVMMINQDTGDMTVMRRKMIKVRNIWFRDLLLLMMTKMLNSNKESGKKLCKRMLSNISLRNRYKHLLIRLRTNKKSNLINIKSKE